MADPIYIQMIADYGVGDPAFAEVIQKFTFLDRSIRITTTSIPAFSTVATGLWISQFAFVNAHPGLVIYSNTAPRMSHTEKNNQLLGGKLAYVKLNNGITVVAVHVGYCFSYLKPRVKEFHLVNVPNVKSQFRSRDYYPDAVVAIAHGDLSHIGKKLSIASIPDVPSNLIAFVDGYGNLKTTMRKSENRIRVGAKVSVTCRRMTKIGVVSDETYKVGDGDISFAAGSTGGDDRFMEIWVRGGSAWKAFGEPPVESEFTVKPI